MPGDLALDDTGAVESPEVLHELERADRAPLLPRLGGMARADGVVIVSERFWAFAGVDGSLREGRMPCPPRSLRTIPLVRGLVRLSASLSPLFRRTGVARNRERWLLALAVVVPFGLAFAPGWLSLAAGFAITAAVMGVGATKRVSAVRWGVAGNIVGAWILTIPMAGLVAAAAYWLIHGLAP